MAELTDHERIVRLEAEVERLSEELAITVDYLKAVRSGARDILADYQQRTTA